MIHSNKIVDFVLVVGVKLLNDGVYIAVNE